MYIDENLRKKLTDDDVKVLKHLQSIDNLFKKPSTAWSADTKTMRTLMPQST